MSKRTHGVAARFGAELAELRKLLLDLPPRFNPVAEGEISLGEPLSEQPSAAALGWPLAAVGRPIADGAELLDLGVDLPDGHSSPHAVILGQGEVARENETLLTEATQSVFPIAYAGVNWPELEGRVLEGSCIGIVDAQWYLHTYQDVAAAFGPNNLEAATKHYFTHGAREGRSPNRYFSEQYYVLKHPEARAAIEEGECTCGYHYFLGMRASARGPTSLWYEEDWYRRRYPDVDAAVTRGDLLVGLQHYLLYGRQEGRSPGPYFDEAWYTTVYDHVGAEFASANVICGLDHYLEKGGADGLSPNPYFDEGWYLETYASANRAVRDKRFSTGFAHYIEIGWHKGLNPNEYFDEGWYRFVNPDAVEGIRSGVFQSGLDHYIRVGRFQRRDPSERFSEVRFAEANKVNLEEELAEAGCAAIASGFDIFLRWRSSGKVFQVDPAEQLLEPNMTLSEFDEVSYLDFYPDVARAVEEGVFSSGFEHWIRVGRAERRMATPKLPIEGRKIDLSSILAKEIGIVFIGLLSAKSGLGAAARGYVSVFKDLDIPLECVDVTPLFDRDATPLEKYKAQLHIRNVKMRYRILFLHLNPDMLRQIWINGGGSLYDDTYVIGHWVWELPSFRGDWNIYFSTVDEVWAPSEFNARGYRVVTSCPIVHMPYVVDDLECVQTVTRAMFNLPHNKYLFLFCFDVSSYTERKNPSALIDAFLSEFDLAEDVALVLKYHKAENNPLAVNLLRGVAARNRNVLLLEGSYTDAEVHSLIGLCDCFVSPHRSEGFGLGIAEAMWLGKPVIATNFGGSVDFVTPKTGFAVPCRREEITTTTGPYEAGQYWAAIDAHDLRRVLRLCFGGGTAVSEVAKRGAAAIRKFAGKEAISTRIAGRLKDLGLLSPKPKPTKMLEQHLMRDRQPRRLQLKATGPDEIVRCVGIWPRRPVISFITPVYNVDRVWLEACVESVRAQYYPYWELCIYDDGSTREETLIALGTLIGVDPRIKIEVGKTNRGIAEASNKAAELATGAYLAFLDNDDTITPDAAYYIADAVVRNPTADLIYCDEDKIALDGKFCETYYKPDFSPEHLMSSGYILHMLVVRKQLFFDLGGFRAEFDGAQDFDLTLRIASISSDVFHIPRILYHWRIIPGSAAQAVNAKPAALANARRALEDHIRRSGRPGRVEDGLLFGTYRVRFNILEEPTVTIIIPTDDQFADIEGRGRVNLVRNLVSSIREKTTYKKYNILVIDNNNASSATRTFLSNQGVQIRSYSLEGGEFVFANKVNFCVSCCDTEMFILLNDDMELINADWIEGLLEWSQLKDIGMVGCRLLYPDGRLQHAGVVLGVCDGAAHIYHGEESSSCVGYNGYPKLVRNYSALSGAVLASRKSVYHSVGGFDPTFPTDYNDIDFCLRVRQAGYRVVYTPFVSLYHFESRTLVRSRVDFNELIEFKRRWKSVLDRDPYYNVNLTRDRGDYSVEPDPRITFD